MEKKIVQIGFDERFEHFFVEEN